LGACTLFLMQVSLPLVAFVSVLPAAGASMVTSDEAGRSSFDVPLAGVPSSFNVSLPDGAVVTSFRMGVATADGQVAPDVPASVTLDLGRDGADWAFGGGEQGAVGWQTALRGGAREASCPVGHDPCSFSFLLPRDARVESFSFDVEPSPNLTLWSTPDFVSVIVGVSAVPLNLSANSAATMADLDNDSTIDLITTGASGSLRVFERVGTTGALFNETAGAINASLRQGRQLMNPQVADMSGDGVPDIIVGTAAGDVTLFVRHNATEGPPFEFQEDPQFFSGVHVASNASPALADLDGDGDLDLVVGSSTGELFHFRNDEGASTGLRWQVLGTFLASDMRAPSDAAPALADLDGDGDNDLTVGESSGAMVLFENTGNATAARFERVGSLVGAAAPARATPEHGDLDGDGAPDIVFGSRGGLVYFSLALGGLPANVTAAIDGLGEPLVVASGPMREAGHVALTPGQRSEFSSASLEVAIDPWGNALEVARVSFSASHFGDIRLGNLSVQYGVTFTLPDLASDYGAYLPNATRQGNRVVVPIALAGGPAAGGGSARVHVPSIAILIDDEPRFIEPPFLSLEEDTEDPYLLDLRTIVADEDPSSVTYEVASSTNETFALARVTDGAYLGVDVAAGDLNDNWTGIVDVVVRATDRLGQVALSPPIRVVVRPMEDAPVIENIATQYLPPNESLRLTVRAIDGDPGDSLHFTVLSPTPPTATIDAATGFLYWNPTSAERAVGTQHLFVYVSDGVLGDVQAFQVVMIPSVQPVFGRPLPLVEILPGRPEFMNLFDYATGNVDEVLSVSIDAHPFVNLSADGQWLAFDYPPDYAPGSDRVEVTIDTLRGGETTAVYIEVTARPEGMFIAPFSPTPLGRGVTHRVELLRYTYQVIDFPNLSFSVDNPLASVTGLNLTLLAPAEYPGQSLTVTVTARAGDETATARWRVNLMAGGELPRLARMPLIPGAVRSMDLGWALAQRGVGAASWPLSADSPHLGYVGADVFLATYPEWPVSVAARDFWPVDRAIVRDARGEPVLEVELGFDGRSRNVDRLQYVGEDEWAVVDATFVTRPDLVGGRVHNTSIFGTGAFAAGPLGDIERLSGGKGTGWRITFTRDTHLEQFSIVGLAEGGGVDSTVSWPIWAVVTPRDDPPAYLGGVSNLMVERDHTLTIDLSQYFYDEEGDDLLFQLSQAGAGVLLDRSTGWLRVDGVETLNLSDLRVIASEARNQSLFAESGSFSIRLTVASAPTPPEESNAILDVFTAPLTVIVFLALGLAASGGLAVYFWTRRRRDFQDARDQASWEAVLAERPPPTEPPVADDPAMVALEEEWSRVIASRHTDGTTPAEETEADLAAGVKSRTRPASDVPAVPESAPERPQMTSSDTETERRAGETETEAPWAKRRIPRR
jgi:hypothetical protein